MLQKNETIDKTVKALDANNMKTTVVKTAENALSYIASLVDKTTTTGNSGSMTLVDSGIIDFLKSNTDYKEERALHHSVDFYFSSANAITENGEIYEVDGHSNRISALVNGPKKVVIVASCNKIVKDLDVAALRVMKTAAPLNAKRLSRKTPCAVTGECIALKTGKRCESEERICSNTLIMEKQTAKDRVEVVLITDENWGY